MGLENILQYLQLIPVLLPLIDQVVGLIEKIFAIFNPSGGQGAIKKALAMQMLEMVPGAALLPTDVLSGLVDGVVGVKNAGGEFKHSVAGPIGGAAGVIEEMPMNPHRVR